MQTDLLNIFFEEAEEHLQSLNENVLNLERNPADMEVVGEIFRSAHTFKGMSQDSFRNNSSICILYL